MSVSVVVTVLNEEHTVGELLTALASQSHTPNRVTVVDGGSTDGTVAAVRSYCDCISGLEVLSAPGTNISQGRNAGISKSTDAIIAVTDAGCVPEPGWLEAMVRPLEKGRQPGFVSGVTVPYPKTHLESCIAQCSLSFRISLGSERFLPTARTMAFHRDLWSAVGGFPEHMDYGEDAAFAVAIRDNGVTICVAEDAKVRWRPRKSYRSVVRQFFRYADGLARGGYSGVFHRRTIAQDLGGFICLALGLLWNHPLPWSLLCLLAAVYVARKVREGCFSVPTWRTYYRVPLVLLAIHCGTLSGIVYGNVVRSLRTIQRSATAS